MCANKGCYFTKKPISAFQSANILHNSTISKSFTKYERFRHFRPGGAGVDFANVSTEIFSNIVSIFDYNIVV